MWRLRFAAAVTFVTLVFLAGRALAETNADVPTGKPDAVIDLATHEGVDLVKGQWRYSDTKIIEVDFKAAGPDKQPTGKPIKTYDFTPHAGLLYAGGTTLSVQAHPEFSIGFALACCEIFPMAAINSGVGGMPSGAFTVIGWL